MRYEVQFRSSGIVAFSASDRGLCQHFIECNNYAPEVPEVDPDTGELTGLWLKGDCLNLFVLRKAK
jgi:hypothetical protein